MSQDSQKRTQKTQDQVKHQKPKIGVTRIVDIKSNSQRIKSRKLKSFTSLLPKKW